MRDIGAAVLIVTFFAIVWPEIIGESVGKIVAAYNSEVVRFGE